MKNESAVFLTLKILSFIIQRLPLSFCIGVLAPCFGRLAFWMLKKKREVILANLRIAFGAEKTLREIHQITLRNFENFAKNIIEILHSPSITPEDLNKMVELVGREHIENALRQGKGVIFLAMHYGNWELSSLVGSALGFPYRIVAHPQKKTTRISQLLNDFRKTFGAEVIFPGFGSKEIIKSLKANQIVSMVIDQGGKEGELVSFLGRRSSMATGAIRLGLKYDIPICPVLIHREQGIHHHLEVHAPVVLKKSENFDQDVNSNLEKIIQFYENAIRQKPDEYMWFYKVWKYTDEYKVLILDDGRTGHLRQSEAIAVNFKDLAAERDKKVSVVTQSVQYRNKFLERLCTLQGFIAQGLPFLRNISFLKFYLTHESFKDISSIYADYIISCGSSMATVNYLLKSNWGVRNIAILKPGLLRNKSFDRVILPQHDASLVKAKDERVIVTRIAPNLINENYIKSQAEILLNHYSHLKNSYHSKIGVMIGGPAKGVGMGEDCIQIVMHQVKEAAIQLSMDIVLTTSRRTPANIENLIARELKRFDHCPLFIIANKNNTPEAVGGILGIANILIVSGESISMVSEAVSSGKKTIVFSLEDSQKRPNTKYEQFVHQLHDQGHLVCASPKDIAQTIYSLVKNKIRTKPVNDQETIRKGLEALIPK